MQELEMSSPALIFDVYFILGMILPIILKGIFRKNETYYIICISTIILFSCFSAEFVTLPQYDPLELTKIFLKFSGLCFGMCITKFFWNRKQRKGGLLNVKTIN